MSSLCIAPSHHSFDSRMRGTGKQLCLEAMQSGHMNGFFKLIQHLSTQAEPAFCGVASLCVVFNAMEIDPRHASCRLGASLVQ